MERRRLHPYVQEHGLEQRHRRDGHKRRVLGSPIDWLSVSRTARRVHTGTKVIDSVGSGETDVTLFTNEQFSSIIGRPFDQASDFVMAMSGEKDSIDRFPISVSYLKRDKSLIARISPGSVDMIRVNYLIITGV